MRDPEPRYDLQVLEVLQVPEIPEIPAHTGRQGGRLSHGQHGLYHRAGEIRRVAPSADRHGIAKAD